MIFSLSKFPTQANHETKSTAGTPSSAVPHTALFQTNFQFRIPASPLCRATFAPPPAAQPPARQFLGGGCRWLRRVLTIPRKSNARHTHCTPSHASAPALSPTTFSKLVHPPVITLPPRSRVPHGRALAWPLPLGRLRRVPRASSRAAAGQRSLFVIKHAKPLNSFFRAPNCSVRAATSRTHSRPPSCPPPSSAAAAAAPLISLLLPPVARQGCRARPIITESISSHIVWQGDAVLSYRDGQSIVEVTVRSMDAKQ